MEIQKINPPSLLPPIGNRHAHIVVTPPNSRLAFLAGQVALDVHGNIVGLGDYYEQSRQVFANIRDGLTAIDAGPHHIVQMTIYVADYNDALLDVITNGGLAVFGEEWPVAATVLIGVAALGMKDFLIEVEAIAAIPA